MSETNKAMNDQFPDRLSVDPNSPYYNAEILARDVGIRFKGVEKTNVEEYCISEGWVRVTAGNAKDRYGNPLTIKVHGAGRAVFPRQGVHVIVIPATTRNVCAAERKRRSNPMLKDATILASTLPQLSLAKDKIRVLLLEGVNDSAVQMIEAAGYSNMTRLSKALEGDALKEAIKGVHLLGIRSRTQITTDVLEAADRLIAIGCFSVGTNQVDLDAARRSGIPVFNAPFSNTRSVAELVIGEIVILLRRIVARSNAAHQGRWDKSADDSYEVRGKTLGIIGYGNIGSQLSNLAEALGMRVIFYDHTDKLRHGNTEPTASLRELLAQSDVVSLHVPETSATHGMIGREEIRAIKPGAYFINNSRGTVVDLEALADALREGRLRGAAVDVFPVEPRSNADQLRVTAAGSGERHSDAAHRRFDRRGAGAHRCRSCAQAGRLQQFRLDDGRRQFPAGPAATAAVGRRGSFRCSAICRACSGV